MIYYQAICRSHGWRSRLFVTELGALNAANNYSSQNPGPHQMAILEVFVPTEALQVRSEQAL